MKWLRVSLAAQALLAVYFQLILWLPLGRWNYQPGFTPLAELARKGSATSQDFVLMMAFALPPVVFAIALAKGWRWLMWICTLGYAIWLALQIKTWWVAYAFGASDAWAAVYRRVFSQSTQLLPAFGRHLPPDGMHLVLQALLTAAVVTAVVGLRKTSARRDSA